MYISILIFQINVLAVHFKLISDAVSGWSGWALADPEFGVSVKPISTRGANYAYHITACPPRIDNLTASLRNCMYILRTFGVHQICSLFCKHPVYFVRGVVQDLQARISSRFFVQGGHARFIYILDTGGFHLHSR